MAPYGDPKILAIKSDVGLSLVDSLGGVEDDRYFEIEDCVPFEEEVVAYPIVLQWLRDDSPVPINCKFPSQFSDWIFQTVQEI